MMRSIEQICDDNKLLESYGLLEPGSAVGTTGHSDEKYTGWRRVGQRVKAVACDKGGSDGLFFDVGYTGIITYVDEYCAHVQWEQVAKAGPGIDDNRWWANYEELEPIDGGVTVTPGRTDGLQDWSVGDTYPYTIVARYDPELDVDGVTVLHAVEDTEHGTYWGEDVHLGYAEARRLKETQQ